MKMLTQMKKLIARRRSVLGVVSGLALFAPMTATQAQQVAVTVIGVDNTVTPAIETDITSSVGYRWLVEEDRTYHVPLDANGEVQLDGAGFPKTDPNWGQDSTISVGFHQSYMKPVKSGTQADIPDVDADKHTFISVLPNSGYSMGAAPIKPGQTDVTVYVNKNPIPTAQIVIRVFEDMAPINNVWDPGEQGLEGFKVSLEDAGGRYGASAGVQSQDAYGNPLCTEYYPIGTLLPAGTELSDGSIADGTTTLAQTDTVKTLGAGCYSDATGFVTIKNLRPGKYGTSIVPPNGTPVAGHPGTYESVNWTQTSTIEGTKIIDAWVKPNEPGYFAEFGPPGPHTEFGFVPAGKNNPYVDATELTGGVSITGQIVNEHLSRPPDTAFYNGAPFSHTTPWVGLNLGAAGQGKGVYAKRANEDGTFSIDNVPPGSYQLVIWDDALDVIFAFYTVIVNTDGTTCNTMTSCDLGDVPVNQWFAHMDNYVFFDQNEDGFRDPGEPGLLEQAVNLRWRDGTLYQTVPTDSEGYAPFDQVFPFFSWLVAEVDFGRFKATGATITVDEGGPIDQANPWSWEGILNPQIQDNPGDGFSIVDPGNPYYRTEQGPVLLQAFQAFLGQTNVIEWGKAPYGPDENGGISGVVYYSVTRAEDDPRYGAPEPWEPGIPEIKVNLYDANDNLISSVLTDSWDKDLPKKCQFGNSATAPYVFRGYETDCFDGMRVWNQVRPGVFDGGYAFGPVMDCSNPLNDANFNLTACQASLNQDGYLVPGRYHVEIDQAELARTPYKIVLSQDKNVDFGDEFTQPNPQQLPPACIGSPYTVPTELSLFPGVPANLAGMSLNRCDKKEVAVLSGANAAADFYLFTEVPIAGHILGFILDDTANEFDPTSPQFGEKYAPPFLPVSIRDWTGREIARTVSDEYGVYNALVPSTYTANEASPSGMTDNMLTTCMNAKMRPDGTVDPLHNPKYSQFCYNFQYMPGTTTYLDTPVLPVAAFTGPNQSPLDCDLNSATPRIFSVSVPDNGVGGGPYVPIARQRVVGTGQLTIASMGNAVSVPNPAYDGVGGTQPKTINRDYSFGATQGTVTLNGVALTIDSWDANTITATIPTTASGRPVTGIDTGELLVTRGDNGNSTTTGITVQVGLRRQGNVVQVAGPAPINSLTGSIQAAIDAAGPNDLILVPPGTYNEMVIMWKPVQLQGWGEGSTIIDAVKQPTEKLQIWRNTVEALVTGNDVSLLDGQAIAFGGIEPGTLFNEEGAGVLVLAKRSGTSRFSIGRNRGARIDGFSITGADTGGGVVVNGYARYMEVSNNRVVNNSGFFGGGIRSGHPSLVFESGRGIEYTDALNDFLKVHHNQVVENGGLSAAGGGITIAKGTDQYQVTSNFVCGNFTGGEGAGIAHYGDSEGGLIADNTVIFNESFNQGLTVNGGGILISGQPAQGCLAGDLTCPNDPARSLTEGSGNVTVARNLIKGNSSGAGDGAGIRLSRINGQEMVRPNGNLRPQSQWNHIEIVNNMIADNVSALAGAGISLQDALSVDIINNTIANNDNASVAGEAFTAGMPSQSNPQPGAGVTSRAHSAALQNFLPTTNTYSNPVMTDNIIWQNRMFYWLLNSTNPDAVISGLCPDLGGLGLGCGTTVVYDDIAVIPAGLGSLSCTNCLTTGGSDPLFVAEYNNGNRDSTVTIPEATTAIQAPAALDEGGNFIRLRFGPLTQTLNDGTTLRGDYHLQGGSPAVDIGGSTTPDDFDGHARPVGAANDIGADEVGSVPAAAQ